MASNRVINAWQDLYSWLPLGKRRFNTCKKGKLPCLNSYPLALNVSFKVRFSIRHSSLHHLYLPYDLFLNELVSIATNYFSLLAMVNILTISRADGRLLPQMINGQLL